MKKKNKKKITILIFLAAFASFIWTQCLFYSQTDLYHNEFWYPYRAKLYHISGAPEALVGRFLIAGNTLSTRSSHGIVRLFSRRIVRARHILFDAVVQEKGYLDILFNSNNLVYKGLRLSRNPSLPSMVYTAHVDGTYLESHKIPVHFWEAQQDKKYQISLRENESGKLVLKVDDKKILEIPEKFKVGFIGLEINEFSTISSPMITFKDGYKILADFKRSFALKYYFINFLIISIIVLSLSLLSFKIYLHSLAIWLNIIIGLGIAWYLFDYFDYSKRTFRWSFPDNSMILREDTPSEIDYEKYRFKFFRSWFQFIGGNIHSNFRETTHVFTGKHPHLRAKYSCKDGVCSNGIPKNESKIKTIRFMILGGSMSEGTGVLNIKDSFHLRIHEDLRKSYGKAMSIESSFLSFIDYKKEIIGEQIDKFKLLISNYNPSYIIVALYTSTLMRSDFSNFINELSQRGIKIIFLEHAPRWLPQDVEDEFKKLDLKNQQEGHIPNIHFSYMYAYLKNKHYSSKGHIWWDFSHITSYGHSLVHKKFFPDFLGIIKKDRVEKKLKF
jgi:hypothetical protein